MLGDVSAYRERKLRVLLFGATGTIGQAALRALSARGHHVVCFVRPSTAHETLQAIAPGAEVREGDVCDPKAVAEVGFSGKPFAAVLSCLASRTGAPGDAWTIDHQAHQNILHAAVEHNAKHMVYLSALCVQKPRLAFQFAKLAFEEALIVSPLRYSIVRPTAFFKSLSGQVERVRGGKPFMVFGNGELTACKPISDRDLANYLCDCLVDEDKFNRVLPIGGPGPSLPPRQQGEALCKALDQEARFQKVPPGLFKAGAALLQAVAPLFPGCADRAEFLRIAHYYATESMLVYDPERGGYSEAATPSYGSDRLETHYQELAKAGGSVDLGDHRLFGKESQPTQRT